MQEHVKLEVSLEIIMAELAEQIFELSKEKNKKTNKTIISKLITLEESAYKGNKETINIILNREYKNGEKNNI